MDIQLGLAPQVDLPQNLFLLWFSSPPPSSFSILPALSFSVLAVLH